MTQLAVKWEKNPDLSLSHNLYQIHNTDLREKDWRRRTAAKCLERSSKSHNQSQRRCSRNVPEVLENRFPILNHSLLFPSVLIRKLRWSQKGILFVLLTVVVSYLELGDIFSAISFTNRCLSGLELVRTISVNPSSIYL